MIKKRNLSGVYFRSRDPATEKFDNVCFEDLSESEQLNILNSKNIEWVKSLTMILAKTLRDVGDQFNLVVTYDNEPDNDS